MLIEKHRRPDEEPEEEPSEDELEEAPGSRAPGVRPPLDPDAPVRRRPPAAPDPATRDDAKTAPGIPPAPEKTVPGIVSSRPAHAKTAPGIPPAPEKTVPGIVSSRPACSEPEVAPARAFRLEPGAVVGAHVLTERVGVGGFGEVWRAVLREHADREDAAPVAIKLSRSAEHIRTLRREAELLARLDHPGIVRTIDVRPDDEPPHIVLELIEGSDLRRVLDACDRRRLGWPEADRIACAVLGAVAAAHDRDVVHGDIKPGNVLLAADGRVVLTDFGLGRAMRTGSGSSGPIDASLSIEAEQSIAGTLAYMAPEARRGAPPDRAADVYAVGVLLYEMLVGAPPRGPWRSLARHGVRAPVGLDVVLRRALHPDPARRPTVAELHQSLVELPEDPDRDAQRSARRCPEHPEQGLRLVRIGQVAVDRCERCGGAWFEHDRLELALGAIARDDAHWLASSGPVDAPSSGACPACGDPLAAHALSVARQSHPTGRIPVGLVARCSAHGIWLPAAVRPDLVRALDSPATAEDVLAALESPETAPAMLRRLGLSDEPAPPPGEALRAAERRVEELARLRPAPPARHLERIETVMRAAAAVPGLLARQTSNVAIAFEGALLAAPVVHLHGDGSLESAHLGRRLLADAAKIRIGLRRARDGASGCDRIRIAIEWPDGTGETIDARPDGAPFALCLVKAEAFVAAIQRAWSLPSSLAVATAEDRY